MDEQQLPADLYLAAAADVHSPQLESDKGKLAVPLLSVVHVADCMCTSLQQAAAAQPVPLAWG